MIWLSALARAGDTDISVDVTGPLAEVRLERRFRRPPSDGPAIDVDLLLPIPAGGAVDGVTVTIGDRVIESRVAAADEAIATWTAAANQGHAASLLEQVHPDLLVEHLANVMPGDEVEVEVALVVPVGRDARGWELVLPLTTGPRFDDDVDLVSVIPPEAQQAPWAPRTVRPEERGDVAVSVHAGTPIAWLESPSHPFRAEVDGGEGRLEVDDVPLDRDLVVRWATSLPDPGASLLVGGGYGLVVLEAPAPWSRLVRNPLDLVVLIDESDSMIGPRSARVPEIVQALLDALGPDDRITVLRFADAVEGLAVREAPADARDLPALLRTAPIGGGGSALAQALRTALAVPAPPDRPVAVVVVSDGGVGDDQGVVAALGRRPDAVVHTIAVGAAPNHGLLDLVAHQSGGVAATVAPQGSIGDALRPLSDGLGPVLTDVVLDWGGAPVRALGSSRVPPMFRDQLRYVTVEGADCAHPLVVRGTLAGRDWTRTVTPTCLEPGRALAVLGARAAMDAEPDRAVEIAVRDQVLGPGTRLVGVDHAIVNPGGVAVATTAPNLLPDDYPEPAASEELEVVDERFARGHKTAKLRKAEPDPAMDEEYAQLAEGKRMESIDRLKGLLAKGVADDTKAEMMLRLADLYFQQGHYLVLRGDPDGGAEWLERAIQLYSGILDAYPGYAQADSAAFYLATALADLGRTAESEVVFARLRRQWPDSPWARRR